MTYAMMKNMTKLMPLIRHKRSQNTAVVGPLVDEVMVVGCAHEDSSRTEGEFGSPAAEFFDNGVVRYCLADDWGEILRPELGQVDESGHSGEVPTNPLAINFHFTHKAAPRRRR